MQAAVTNAFDESGWLFDVVINCCPIRDPARDTGHLGFSAHALGGVMLEDVIYDTHIRYDIINVWTHTIYIHPPDHSQFVLGFVFSKAGMHLIVMCT